MIVEVARNTARSVREVAEDSYAVSLYTFLQLLERDRIERILSERNRIDQAGLMAFAFHEPKKLSDIGDRFRRSIKSKPTREEALRRAALLMVRIEKSNRKKPKRRQAKG